MATVRGRELGSRSLMDVLNAERQLYAAVREYNNARYDYVFNTLSLKQVAGVLNAADLTSLTMFMNKGYDPDRDFLPPG